MCERFYDNITTRIINYKTNTIAAHCIRGTRDFITVLIQEDPNSKLLSYHNIDDTCTKYISIFLESFDINDLRYNIKLEKCYYNKYEDPIYSFKCLRNKMFVNPNNSKHVDVNSKYIKSLDLTDIIDSYLVELYFAIPNYKTKRWISADGMKLIPPKILETMFDEQIIDKKEYYINNKLFN